MKTNILAATLASVLSAAPATSFAGPFGLEMGKPATTQGCIALESSPGLYKCVSVDKPHSAFETYIVQSSEQHGVCWIKGIGKNISDNGYGTSTKSKAEEIVPLITARYGVSHKLTAFLFPNALWKDSDEFLMSLMQKERIHMYKWDGVSKDGVASIAIVLQASGSSSGYLALEYYGTDYDECDDAIKSAEGDAF